MDLNLNLRVMWRFRYLVFAGLLLAAALAFLSFVHVSRDGISYRQQVTYRATQRLLLTTNTSLFDPTQQASIAALGTLQVQIANSDVIRSQLRRRGPLRGSYVVYQVQGPNSTLLPVIAVDA